MSQVIVSGFKLGEVMKRVQEWESKGYECMHQIAKIEKSFKYFKHDMTTYRAKFYQNRRFVCTDGGAKYIVKMRLIESEVTR